MLQKHTYFLSIEGSSRFFLVVTVTIVPTFQTTFQHTKSAFNDDNSFMKRIYHNTRKWLFGRHKRTRKHYNLENH